MSLLADLKERFKSAQDRRQELEQTLEERREAAEKAKALELQIEAEEWAEKAPALLMELQEIMGELMPMYFQFEMTARLHLNAALFLAPVRAWHHQASALSALYINHEAVDFSIYTGERKGSRKALHGGTEGVDTRHSGCYDNAAARATELRKKGPDFRHEAYALEQIAERQAQEARFNAMTAPDWLPRLEESSYQGVSNATILQKAWEA